MHFWVFWRYFVASKLIYFIVSYFNLLDNNCKRRPLLAFTSCLTIVCLVFNLFQIMLVIPGVVPYLTQSIFLFLKSLNWETPPRMIPEFRLDLFTLFLLSFEHKCTCLYFLWWKLWLSSLMDLRLISLLLVAISWILVTHIILRI